MCPSSFPPSHQFFKVFLDYLNFFHILYTCIYNILIRRNCGYQEYRGVSGDTAQFTGWVQVVPTMGMVFGGMGTVWENLTHRLPVLNANSHCVIVL